MATVKEMSERLGCQEMKIPVYSVFFVLRGSSLLEHFHNTNAKSKLYVLGTDLPVHTCFWTLKNGTGLYISLMLSYILYV